MINNPVVLVLLILTFSTLFQNVYILSIIFLKATISLVQIDK